MAYNITYIVLGLFIVIANAIIYKRTKSNTAVMLIVIWFFVIIAYMIKVLMPVFPEFFKYFQ